MLESRLSHVTRKCLWEELDDADDGKTICVCADQHNYRLLNKTSNIFCSSDYFCKLLLVVDNLSLYRYFAKNLVYTCSGLGDSWLELNKC